MKSGNGVRGCLILLLWLPALGHRDGALASDARDSKAAAFQTSDRCVACHNGMVNSDADEYSIGLDWRASLMANSSRDPYWQASLRRETLDHGPAGAAIEDECSACHMAIPHYQSKQSGVLTPVFANLPLSSHPSKAHADGVTCSVCHQITPERLGTAESYNGNFLVNGAAADGSRAEFGPVRNRGGLATDHAELHGGVSTTAWSADPIPRVVRELPHADHRGARRKRKGGWLSPGADDLPGVATQRVSQRANVSVLPHASRRKRCSGRAYPRGGTAGCAPPSIRGRELCHAENPRTLSR